MIKKKGDFMIKIIMFLDQIQSGFGTKDDKMVPLGGSKDLIGPGMMLSPFLKEIDAKVVATLYCGNGTYLNDPEGISKKICDKVEKFKPDIVICGPAFNFADYSLMCGKIANDINKTTSIKAIAAMSKENEEVISKYKDEVLIVETPKKGGVGLNDSLEKISKVVKEFCDGVDQNEIRNKYCFK